MKAIHSQLATLLISIQTINQEKNIKANASKKPSRNNFAQYSLYSLGVTG